MQTYLLKADGRPLGLFLSNIWCGWYISKLVTPKLVSSSHSPGCVSLYLATPVTLLRLL